MAYNPFVNEEARDSYFAFEQAVIHIFWVERVRELETITSEQLQFGAILEERVIEPSVPQLEGQVGFEFGSLDGPLKTSLVTMWELMKPSWCPFPNAGLIWDLTAEIELDGNDDDSLHNLAMIHHLMALKKTRQDDKQPTEPSEGNSPSYWMKEGTCLASSCRMEGHLCGNGHSLKTLNEHHRQLAKLYGRLSMSDKNEMEMIADCHGVTEVNLKITLGFCSMTSSSESSECLERAYELVTSLSVEVFPGALKTKQKIGSWREALENEMNLKHS